MAQPRDTGTPPTPAVPGMQPAAEAQPIICPNPGCHRPNLRRARFCQHCGSAVVLNTERPTDERRYVLTRILKEGGQGAVYVGLDQFDKPYAIKEMLDRFSDPKERDEAVNRFNEEALLLQSLSHSRIPRVYSHFTDGGRHYLTMDYVYGEDLDVIVEREGRLPESQVLAWADQLCDVLSYLHSKGLIYRDMKPANVMIERDSGSVKLIDFGIAKFFKPAERGSQIGTPGYAPPEQYQGFATPASDVYSLAATLHHLLTGRDPTEHAPFSFPPARSLNSGISRQTSDALAHALRQEPKERFATVAAFRSQLQATAPAPRQPAREAAPRRGATPVLQPKAPPPATAVAARPAAPAQPVPGQANPMTRPAQQAQPRRGGWFRGLLRAIRQLITTVLITLVLGAAAVFGLYTWQPELAERYISPIIPTIERMLPQQLQQVLPQPAPAATTMQPFSADLRVTLPVSADADAVRDRFLNEYEQAVMAHYGVGAVVSRSQPPSFEGGSPQRLREEAGQVVYQARMQGLVQQP
ncbi:MAG: serine/threonine protein kinase [Chloroflexaceae bacterium]|jgi:serine/threonine-protein kinase|nr:serine/threonine protein kinase [Chloroflexaceae bacterium]